MANWWLGKNLGVPQGSWKNLGKKLGIGLTEGDRAYQQQQRERAMMERGQLNTPEEQAMMAGEASPEVRERTSLGMLDYLAKGRGEEAYTGVNMPSALLGKSADTWTSKDVGSIQEHLNRAGYTDYEGKPLKEDSMLGDRTLSALRKFQQDMGRHSSQDLQGPYMESGMFSDQRDENIRSHSRLKYKADLMKKAGFKLPPGL